MLKLVFGRFGFNLRMALQADLSGHALDELILLRAVGGMTNVAIAFSERNMGRLCRLLADQLLMTGQAELSLNRRQLKQSGNFSTMWCMATRAISAGERSVLSEKTFFQLGFLMTGKTHFGFCLCQQFTLFRLMRGMAFETATFLGRSMWVLGLGVSFLGMATEA
jgi:hypothetical protein